MFKKFLVPLSLAVLLASGSLSAQEIGLGFICSGTQIVTKKGKVVKPGAAKNKVNAKLSKIPKTKKTKAKRASLQAIKKQINACKNGELGSDPGEDPGQDPGTGENSQFLGLYEGQLTKIDGRDVQGGCSGDTVNWRFLVRLSETSGKLSATGATPFARGFSGDAVGTGFVVEYERASSVKGEKFTITATNVTDTSATIRFEEEITKRGEFSCSGVYTAEFTRDKNAES